MRRSTKRVEDCQLSSGPALEIVRPNHRCDFKIGDRVRMRTGLQEFTVYAITFCDCNGRYLIQAKFGPCHFFRWAEDVERV